MFAQVRYHNTALGEIYHLAIELAEGETVGEVAYGRGHRLACEMTGWQHFDVIARWL
jgi:hypothetical protein